MPPSSRNLQIALGVSVVLHVVLLSIHFKLPQAIGNASAQALAVILVNKKSAHKPSDAQAKAQVNADGGGNTDEDRIVSSPIPPSQQTQEGNDLIEMQKRTAELEALQTQLLTSARSTKAVTTSDRRPDTKPDAPSPKSGQDYADSARAFAQQLAAVEQTTEEYNKRPRKKFVGVRTEEVRYAQYMEAWREKVERIGTLNYPESARGKLSGQPVISVTINKLGELVSVELIKTSGYQVLDDAAMRIVKLAAPYAKFPPDIAKEFDQLDITRQWTFTTQGGFAIGK